jgi:hypothetical protein
MGRTNFERFGSGDALQVRQDLLSLGAQGGMHMLRVLRLGITAGMLGALLITSSASAARPIVFTIDVVFDDPSTPNVDESSETFHSDGSVICAVGPAVTDPFFFAGGGSKGRGNATYHLEKTLTCGNGTITIAVDAAATATGTVGGWTVVSGTGAYAGLSGSGQVVGTGVSQSLLRDAYTGRLTN